MHWERGRTGTNLSSSASTSSLSLCFCRSFSFSSWLSDAFNVTVLLIIHSHTVCHVVSGLLTREWGTFSLSDSHTKREQGVHNRVFPFEICLMPLSVIEAQGCQGEEEKRTPKKCKEQKHQKHRHLNQVFDGEIDKRRKGMVSPFSSKPTVLWTRYRQMCLFTLTERLHEDDIH